MTAERAKAAGEIRSGNNLQWEQLKAGAICGASDWQWKQFTSSDRQREHLQGAMGRKSNLQQEQDSESRSCLNSFKSHLCSYATYSSTAQLSPE